MIFVTGCGFCATNGIMKVIHEETNIKVYSDCSYIKVNRPGEGVKHPYPKYEDIELFHYQHQRNMVQVICQQRPEPWATKIPNGYQYLSHYAPYITKVIAGVRPISVLLDRMIERWELTKAIALDRIRSYIHVVNVCKRRWPTLIVDQRTFNNDKITSFVNGETVT